MVVVNHAARGRPAEPAAVSPGVTRCVATGKSFVSGRIARQSLHKIGPSRAVCAAKYAGREENLEKLNHR